MTKHFKLHEFACADGTALPKKYQKRIYAQAFILETLRLHLGCTIIINSAHRTSSHNRKVGGVINSFHISALALDISTRNMTAAQESKFLNWCIKMKELNLIRYFQVYPGQKFIHIDFGHIQSML